MKFKSVWAETRKDSLRLPEKRENSILVLSTLWSGSKMEGSGNRMAKWERPEQECGVDR